MTDIKREFEVKDGKINIKTIIKDPIMKITKTPTGGTVEIEIKDIGNSFYEQITRIEEVLEAQDFLNVLEQMQQNMNKLRPTVNKFEQTEKDYEEFHKWKKQAQELILKKDGKKKK